MAGPQNIPIKYVKSLLTTGSTDFGPTHAVRFVSRLLYEFWGFCVNGGSDLRAPGGIVDLSFPSDYASGSTVLLASGSDGTTNFGTDVFASQAADFVGLGASRLIGKYLVTWIPGSSSTDDSVYRVISVEDANHIRVDVSSGGTRRLGNVSCFWDRNGINWRLVDLVRATQLSGWQSGNYTVLQLGSAASVNPSQVPPQVRLSHLTQSVGFGTNLGLEGNLGINVAPSGSWDTTLRAFTGVTGSQLITTWFNGVPSGSSPVGQCSYTFIGGGDFLIAEARSYVPGPQGSYTSGSGFHIEVPLRNMSSVLDPSPVAWLAWANATPSQVAGTYYDGFNMVGHDDLTRKSTTLVRSLGGTRVRPDQTGHAYGTGQWQQFVRPTFRFSNVAFNPDDMSRLSTDGILSSLITGKFCAARARLRRVRFTTADIDCGARLGDPTLGTAWVHVSNGVLWPWDNSILPAGPWRFGV